MVKRPVRHSGSFYVRCMSMCAACSTDYIQQCQSLYINFYTKHTRRAASGRVKPGPSACQLDALTIILPAPLVMKFQM